MDEVKSIPVKQEIKRIDQPAGFLDLNKPFLLEDGSIAYVDAFSENEEALWWDKDKSGLS